MDPTRRLVLICKALWTLLHGSLMHTFDPLCVFKWFTGCKPDNTQWDDSLLSLNNQTSWATCFICVLFRITGIARVDGVIHSTDLIFASSHELWCRHVYHTCAFRMSNMRGKDTLHSNGGCLRLNAVHATAWCMDTVSIVNGNVCGRFRDILAQKVRFL
jgi:hypothetical protein